MAALAPFFESPIDDLAAKIESVAWVPPTSGNPSPDAAERLASPRSIEQEIARRALLLASEPGIGEDLRFFVDDLADQLIDIPDDAALRVDPYFLLAAQRALIGSLRALDSTDTEWARQQIRIRLEQLRQVYRDLADGEVVYEDRPAKEVAQWLVEALDVSQARLAELAGVSARTFQRWISTSDLVGPEGEDARRLRVIAGVANHLRHVLTGPGVVLWFEQPSPQLDGSRPLDLLDNPGSAGRLATLAASARSHSAA